MTDTFSIQIHNRKLFEQNQPGEWLKLPATTEQLHAAMQRIGITDDNQQDFFINGIDTQIEAIQDLSFNEIQRGNIDEYNYLAARLEAFTYADIKKMNAASEHPNHGDNIYYLLEYTHNTDYFVFTPEIQSVADLGDYYLNKSQMVQMPEEWKAAVDVEQLGTLAAEQENGLFINNGYILESGDEWQPVNEIPQEYRIMSFPQLEQDRQNIDYDTMPGDIPTAAITNTPELAPEREPQLVIPITFTTENPANRLKEITDKLESGIADIFSSDQYQDYLNTLAKFHNYSLNNTILIAIQKPDASHVAGYGAWKKDFERQVKKGEKGIRIIAPSPYTVKREMDKIDPDTQKPIIGADGKPETEEKKVKIPAFKVISVFDISQTEGKELPTIGADELIGSVDNYKDFYAALEKASPVPIAFEDIDGKANGYYHLEDKRIAIDEGMSELQTLKTTIHEIAHARLHDIDLNAPVDEQNRIDRRTREVEAESIAYTVCQNYGLDTSDYSFGYVAGWSSGKELAELKASLETIRTTAAELITEIDGHFAELQQDREQSAELPIFDTLPPEQQQALFDEAEATLQFFIDSDLQDKGELSDGTLEAIAVRGYSYSGGKLEKMAEPEQTTEHEPQPDFEETAATETTPEQDEQTEQETYKYYSTQRPIDIGTFPKGENSPLEIVNFDNRIDVENGAFQAWGYLVYKNPLSEKEISDYELRAAPELVSNQHTESIDGVDNEITIATLDEPATVKYYSINEEAARRAKQANSFYDYKPGSATAEYKQSVDEIVEVAERHKKRVDPMHHEKIDRLVDTYARKLAENMNNSYSIESRVPSIMIAGPSNFPVRQKEKQNAARDKNMREWRYIQGLRDKIRSVGMGGISADDPNATNKLQEKLSNLEQLQETMKTANAYYRKHKTLDGCPVLSAEQIQKLSADMKNRFYGREARQPFEPYALQNNNAEIRRIKGRIEELKNREETVLVGWEFDGGKVDVNKPDNRLQVFFDEKPDEDTRKELKSNGFRWTPSAGA